MFKKIIKGILKWIIITILVGAIIWFTSSLYRFIRKKVKGR